MAACSRLWRFHKSSTLPEVLLQFIDKVVDISVVAHTEADPHGPGVPEDH